MVKDTAFEQKKKAQWAWYMYDFGNSAYAAVILLAVYSAYFKGAVVGGAEGTKLWGYALGIAMLVVAVISPVLGAIADHTSSKKQFLFAFSALSWLFTALLFFVQKGDVFTGMLFFILAEIGYRGGQVFYNSLLIDVADVDEMGSVSGNGWAIGSVGGIICLLILLPLIVITKGDAELNNLVIRGSFVFTAIYFLFSALPIFLKVKEKNLGQPLARGENYLQIGFKRLGETFRAVKGFKEFIKYIIAFLIFNDGIMMALDFAAIIGAVLFGMNQTQLIIFMIIIQVTSAIGAYVFGILGSRTGYKRSLLISLALMLVAIIWMIFEQTLFGFFLIGSLAGFALTGVQSVSRTMTGMFAPASRSTEFFGFFSFAGRSSSFIGPTIYGILAFQTATYFQDMGMSPVEAEKLGQRGGIVSIGLFLIIGGLVLLTVNERKARQAAIEFDSANVK